MDIQKHVHLARCFAGITELRFGTKERRAGYAENE